MIAVLVLVAVALAGLIIGRVSAEGSSTRQDNNPIVITPTPTTTPATPTQSPPATTGPKGDDGDYERITPAPRDLDDDDDDDEPGGDDDDNDDEGPDDDDD